MLPAAFTLVDERLPAAAKDLDRVGVVIDFGNAGRDAFQEPSVVADHHHAGLLGQHPVLQHVEAGEVEVVCRLVQQVQVKPGQDQRGESDAGGLPAGEVVDRLTEESGGKPNLGCCSTHAGVEIGRPDVHPTLKRQVVTVGGAVCVGGQILGCVSQFDVGGRNARAFPQDIDDGWRLYGVRPVGRFLVPMPVALLAEPADVCRRG